MIVQMRHGATQAQSEKVINFLKEKGFEIKDVSSDNVIIFGVIGDTKYLNASDLEAFSGVFQVTRIQTPYKLVRQFKSEDTIIHIKDDIYIGEGYFEIIAGTCAVETKEITEEVAKALVSNGVKILEVVPFKPRTSLILSRFRS